MPCSRFRSKSISNQLQRKVVNLSRWATLHRVSPSPTSVAPPSSGDMLNRCAISQTAVNADEHQNGLGPTIRNIVQPDEVVKSSIQGTARGTQWANDTVR